MFRVSSPYLAAFPKSGDFGYEGRLSLRADSSSIRLAWSSCLTVKTSTITVNATTATRAAGSTALPRREERFLGSEEAIP